MSEYEVIDYIQTLNTNKVEGAQAEQTEEGRYSDFRYFIEDLRDELVKTGNSMADTITIDNARADGTVLIDDLDYGYYVLDEVTANAGTHSASSLCIVDTANPLAEVSLKSDFPSVEKKVQEDDHQELIGNNGWNDMGDFEIGQNISFQFTSHVPDMNGYDTYYYAWHDVMDTGLTFDADSVEVVISSELDSYTLEASEYNVTENQKGETFVVEIEDLKTIVDTQFNKMDSLGHNTYGQTVTLRYQAALNENALTGAQGVENDVRLEFSNDPDGDGAGKTGFTPWDTVVCFTYRLHGVKVNDDDAVLEGAKFRLYRDEACEDEIYVKQGTNGYVVFHEDLAEKLDPSNAVEMVSDENGLFYITGLDQGTYYLKETQAPDGYRDLLDPIKITITPVFVSERNAYVKGESDHLAALSSLTFSAYVKEFLSGVFTENESNLETDVQTGTGNLTVVNTKGVKLPVTGSSLTIILLCTGAAMMTMAYKKDRKRKRNEG